MRLFSQSLSGDDKKWYRSLPDNTIRNFQEFENQFLRQWEDKKNPLQLLTQYNNLKRSSTKIVQEFSMRFMKAYDAIPAEVKPHVGVAQLHYADSFGSNFALLLIETR